MHFLANPNRFIKLMDTLNPWVFTIFIISSISGVIYALFISPPDYQQGDSVRIMYVHVPSAWMALFSYTIMAFGSISYLIWKHPIGNLIAKGSAPIGALFTTLCLVTGMIWGKPMWGAYWVWDARLTSMLILLFLFLGYILIGRAFDNPEHANRVSAIFAIAGSINLPIVKFSVDWWNTLHQPSIFSMQGISVSNSMLTPLILMTIAFHTYYFLVLMMNIRRQVLISKINNYEILNISKKNT
jgi:heme exporter protein C